jgi:uncharacterized protein (UPF0332 family)
MTFDWSNYLTVAERLASGDLRIAEEEACLRSAISRAYYAVFGMARSHARQDRVRTRMSGAEHGEIVVFFSRRYGAVGEEIAAQMNNLRRLRNRADYDDVFEELEESSLDSLSAARDVLALLATL